MGQPAGDRDRPDPPAARCRGATATGPLVSRAAPGRSASTGDGYVEHADLLAAPTCRPGPWWTGPAVIEEYGATVPLHPGFTATVDRLGNLIVRRSAP